MKKIIAVLVICLILFSFSGCDTVKTEKEVNSKNSMFVVVETADLWKVVYHKETKVMYVVSYEAYNCGTFTLLVDENGNPLLWEGET